MNATQTRRWAAVEGLVLAAVVACWWLGSARLAIEQGADPARSAVGAASALLFVRALLLALLGPRASALRGARAGIAEALALIAPSWSLLVLAGSASTLAWSRLALGEASLVAAGAALAFVGAGLRRWMRRPEAAEVVAIALGIALAAGLWSTRAAWTWA